MDNAHKVILDLISKTIPLSDKEKELLISSFQVVNKNKNEYLLNNGFVAKQLYFTISGYARSFYSREEGEEITTHLFGPHEFVTSFESFVNKDISTNTIQCLTDCEFLCITKEAHENLYSGVEHWTFFCNKVYEFYIQKIAERVNLLQNLSASERYEQMLRKQPLITRNASVKHLASYLGIQPQSLSRIRRKIK